jgi:hypothetical protein
MRAKRKIVKETFENRHNLGFSEEQVSDTYKVLLLLLRLFIYFYF